MLHKHCDNQCTHYRGHQQWQGLARPNKTMHGCSLSTCVLCPHAAGRLPEAWQSTAREATGAQAAGGRNNGKGLRHFSMKVCEKVESKGRTTYNEVADELVGEFSGAARIPLVVSASLMCSLTEIAHGLPLHTPSPVSLPVLGVVVPFVRC